MTELECVYHHFIIHLTGAIENSKKSPWAIGYKETVACDIRDIERLVTSKEIPTGTFRAYRIPPT